MEQLTEQLFRAISDRIGIELETSGRHVHLSASDRERLFPDGLHPVRPLSQPGQFVCAERVSLIGTKGRIDGVVVLGPERKETQVEVSLTDARILGETPPIRLSGEIAGSSPITLAAEGRELRLSYGMIVARRHIHLTPEDAARQGVSDGQVVRLKCLTSRPLIFDDVVCRVSKRAATYVHIDYDEGNACGYRKGDRGIILT